jgi:hypothetical protein
MNYDELMVELVTRKALIVHCSRPGKADLGSKGLLFPCDLHNANDICANQGKELCCSVIWPGHVETFGDIGIILKPRSTASVTSICTTDGGTWFDPGAGKRLGAGDPFSRQTVIDTFLKATTYNEWNVRNVDTIGIFVASEANTLQVAKAVDPTQIPGYDPSLDLGRQVVPCDVTLPEIAAAFPNLPIYTIKGADIVQILGGIASPYA